VVGIERRNQEKGLKVKTDGSRSVGQLAQKSCSASWGDLVICAESKGENSLSEKEVALERRARLGTRLLISFPSEIASTRKDVHVRSKAHRAQVEPFGPKLIFDFPPVALRPTIIQALSRVLTIRCCSQRATTLRDFCLQRQRRVLALLFPSFISSPSPFSQTMQILKTLKSSVS